jgi:hypothetical protein
MVIRVAATAVIYKSPNCSLCRISLARFDALRELRTAQIEEAVQEDERISKSDIS